LPFHLLFPAGPGGNNPLVVLQQLVPLLPLVVQHLALAVGLLQQPPEGGNQLLVAGEGLLLLLLLLT
jgi:hypothetical protein